MCIRDSVKVVASNHDFHKTPAKSDIIYRLRKMQDMGADIPKIAVMPQNKRDAVSYTHLPFCKGIESVV